MRAIAGITPALRHDFRAEADLIGGAFDEVVARQCGEARKEILGELRGGKLRADFCAVAFGDARDDRFLGGKVAVEIARAHPRFGADVLHRGLMEAGARDATPRGLQNFGPAIFLKGGTDARHGSSQSDKPGRKDRKASGLVHRSNSE